MKEDPMQPLQKLKTFVIIFLLTLTALAQATDSEATKPLNRQMQLIDSLKPFADRQDLARLYVINSSIRVVIQDMNSNVAQNKSEVTVATIRILQNLMIQYRFSQVFFGWQQSDVGPSGNIVTNQSTEILSELKTLSDDLVTEYGFDDSPYTQITANTFKQMQVLIQGLEAIQINPLLKERLNALMLPIAETVAVASQGDRPKTFEKAIPLVQTIRKLYPLFDQIAMTQAGFGKIMEIQGLNEFYAEFSQVSNQP